MYSDLWLLDVIKSIEPLIHGEPPGPTSDKPFGRRLFANGTWDRHGLARLRPQPSDLGREGHDNGNDAIGNGGTRIPNTTGSRPDRGAMMASQSDGEDFDLDAVSGDDTSSSSSGGEVLRGHKFQRKVVRIKMSPVKPAPKSKPSYVELSDSEEMPLRSARDAPETSNHGAPTAQEIGRSMVDHEAHNEMSLREVSKGKGKARAISKRKATLETVEHVHGRTARVRNPVCLVDWPLTHLDISCFIGRSKFD